MPLDVGTFDNVGTRGLLFYITKLNSDNIVYMQAFLVEVKILR